MFLPFFTKKHFKVLIIIFCVFWTSGIVGSCLWNLWVEKQELTALVTKEAMASFNKDLVYRRWAAGHGGVYAPVTKETPPNPYLSHLPERDVSTPSGRLLTLINPAYMTRQVYQLAKEQYGVQGHITSLNPIRKENAPDQWEEETLQLFNQGADEFSEISLINGEPYLRFMRVLKTENRCLKCHAVQGYNEGDIRGGISVSVPLSPYHLASSGHIKTLITAHFIIWMIGVIFFCIGARYVWQQLQLKSENEETMRQMEKKIQQSYKLEAIGTLAGGIAHDFNNILGVILGYTEMAKDDAPPGTQLEKDLRQVLIAANRAKDLVKQILTFSRQDQVERIPIKIQPLIKEGLKMLRSSIPTTISITQDINPIGETVLADPTQVHQILMNLCTNAYQAMEETGGTLSVALKNTFITDDDLHVTHGEYVELSVSDTGIGIGPDVIDKIFDPYFTTKEIGKGTGMGLAIIHGIIKEYGGEITVDSQLGKGSTFHVYFPVIEKDAVPKAKESDDIPKGKERILFIDDEELLAEMGKDMLERLGYQVTVRRSSIEALTTFQNTPNKFDIVITDQTMPDMTGADLARRILQIRPDIPIILCTGYSSVIDEDSAKGLGIKEFALKPITKGVISKLIRKVLDDS